MTFLEKKNELKLNILESLVRSQGAVAAMLEGLAETARWTGGDTELAEKYLKEIAGYQRVLAERLLTLKVREVYRGKPASPWLASECMCRRDS
ncbi:Uncharacterised protein [Chlamydia abortus]|jgi:hypothetical protein|uniref:hypothetical protein n=1 Tax=unclassified Paenibacillus TaxID=185978 RepID=UPI000A27EB51|nr:hypothetical protein [Paenibacillus sp. 32O-W]SHE12412.1 Uncharacterised protein [Chlamydia abortus]